MEERITLRYPSQLRRQIKVAAAEQDQSMNAWIVEAIRDKLQRRKIMANLMEITGNESGAIMWEDGNLWIGNWSSIDGLPRVAGFLPGAPSVGLGEELKATPCEVPEMAIEAMQEHELEQGEEPSSDGFRAWQVNDAIVVTQKDWN